MIRTQEKEHLLQLYANRKAFHGEMHDHANSGGTSDGKCTLEQWREQMQQLHMDFAAILDHRQVRHMYLPAWEDGLFIPGTEPGTVIPDSQASRQDMHYLILLPHRDELEKLLQEFPEYQFTGGTEGHFIYPDFTRERFGQLIDAVKARGGFFVHPHPRQYLQSDDPCQYWFRDETGIEVFYWELDSEFTKANYDLWTQLLAAGKRVWACAGGDQHCDPHDYCLTTIYAEERTSPAFLTHLRKGDFTCGAVGVRMCMGDTLTGGQCAFEGQTLTVCVSDFHPSVQHPSHEYRLDVMDDEGTVLTQPIPCEGQHFVTLPARTDAKFYRAEVFDATLNLRIAVGNPIWNK